MKNIMQNLATCGAMSALIATSVLGFTSQAEAQALIVNEFNAVGPSKKLEGGGSDPVFGRVNGNGGEWVELVVTQNGLDLTGWQLVWENDDVTTPKSGVLTFTGAAPTNNLSAGTIITVRLGDTSVTGTNKICGAGADWWIRLGAGDSTFFSSTGSTFQTDNDGWRMTILDNFGSTVQDWVGETSPNETTIWAGTGINSEEVGKLEANPVAAPSTNLNYHDGNCSSFGSPNCWTDPVDAGAGGHTQDFCALRGCSPGCVQ